MSSSLITSTVVGSTLLVQPSLLDLLARVTDPRKRRGIRYRLVSLLAVGLAAVIAGARSFTAISEWVTDAHEGSLSPLGVMGTRRPSEATIRRAFTRVDGDLLDTVIGAWMQARVGTIAGRRVIALDGKTVRGARHGTATAPHLVAALEHSTGTVLGQLQVAVKSNEIPAVRDLLDRFELSGTLVTIDAMHTQRDTAAHIVAAGGHYLMTVKGNQPTLHRWCKSQAWAEVPGSTSTETGHGRRTTRTIKVLQVTPTEAGFPHTAQLAQIRRTRTIKGRKSVEVIYLICSLGHLQAPVQTLAAWIQGHWGIENRLHWVRDVTYDEDRSRIRTGNAPRVMATLRSTAISLLRLAGHDNIATALRHHARDPTRPTELILHAHLRPRQDTTPHTSTPHITHKTPDQTTTTRL